MADISSWSPVDASNNASPPNGWPENMLASAVNDCARAMMGAIRRNYDQMITGTFAFTNITASGTVTAGYIHSTGDVAADNAVTAPYIHSTGDLHADGAVTAPNITASGTVTAGLVYSTGDVAADNAVTAPYIHSTGDLHADGAVTAPNITASGTVTAAQLTSTGNITADGQITGAVLVTTGAVSAAGNITSGGQITGGLVVSTGDISAAGNIHGIGYFCDGMAALDILNVSTPTGPHPAPSLLNDFAAPAIQVHSQNNLYASTVHIFVDNGGGYAPLQASAFVVSSDRRLKTDIEPSTPGLPEVLRLNPVSFRRLHAQQGRETGFIAQDVQEALPQAVTSIDLNGEAMLAINDMPILAALVNAIKNLSARLDSLEAR